MNEGNNKECAGCFWEEGCRRADIDYYGGCELFANENGIVEVGTCAGCAIRILCKECGDPCEWYWPGGDEPDEKYYDYVLREAADEYYEMIKEYSDGNAD